MSSCVYIRIHMDGYLISLDKTIRANAKEIVYFVSKSITVHINTLLHLLLSGTRSVTVLTLSVLLTQFYRIYCYFVRLLTLSAKVYITEALFSKDIAIAARSR